MAALKQMLRVSAVALIASAPAAFADVTADDVWAQIKSSMTMGGQMLTTGSEAKSGDTLTVTGAELSMDTPEAKTVVTLPTLEFTENGDGTVSVVTPSEYPVAIKVTPPGGEAVDIAIEVKQTNVNILASGTPDAIAYAFTGDAMTISATTTAPDPDGPVDLAIDGTLTGLTGNYSLGAGEVRAVSSSTNARSLGLTLNIQDSKGSNVDVKITSADLTSSTSGTVPAAMNAMAGDLGAMMKGGFAIAGTASLGASDISISGTDQGQTFDADGKASSAAVDFKMAPDGMSYATRTSDLQLTLSGSQIPLPQVALSLAEAGFGLTMPIAKSDTPQDAGLLVRLVGLSVDEAIWGMLDPTGQLPHDPATLIVDLAGTANWLVDITAPDAEAQMERGTPGQIHTLDIRELDVAMAGAELTGTGGFTFDNEDLMTWGGMPAPEGKVDLKLVGGVGLLDKLVAMGLVPQDQAMGAKMMLGLFAQPGEGADTMVSTIEVKKEGSVFANGQQIK